MEKEYNPHLVGYADMDGELMRLEECIKIEVTVLAEEFLERYGVTPDSEMIRNWMKRLKRAYHTKQVITTKDKK